MGSTSGVDGGHDASRADRSRDAGRAEGADRAGDRISGAEADAIRGEAARVPESRVAAEADRLTAERDTMERAGPIEAAAEWAGQTAKGYATGAVNLGLETANAVNGVVNAGLSAVGVDFRFDTEMGLDPTSDAERHAQNAVNGAALVTGVAGAVRSAPAMARAVEDLAGLARKPAASAPAAAAAVRAGDLTPDEIAQIQSAAERLGDDIYVVGSAARGARRNVGSDLPLGRFGGGKEGTRSDIDYAVRLDLDDAADALGLPDVDPTFGVRGLDYINLDSGPALRFSPGRAPERLEGAGKLWLTDRR